MKTPFEVKLERGDIAAVRSVEYYHKGRFVGWHKVPRLICVFNKPVEFKELTIQGRGIKCLKK